MPSFVFKEVCNVTVELVNASNKADDSFTLLNAKT